MINVYVSSEDIKNTTTSNQYVISARNQIVSDVFNSNQVTAITPGELVMIHTEDKNCIIARIVDVMEYIVSTDQTKIFILKFICNTITDVVTEARVNILPCIIVNSIMQYKSSLAVIVSGNLKHIMEDPTLMVTELQAKYAKVQYLGTEYKLIVGSQNKPMGLFNHSVVQSDDGTGYDSCCIGGALFYTSLEVYSANEIDTLKKMIKRTYSRG